ncbi:2'-5' RNA ligase family protein [Glycomyces salinus]|uniref:2'-5' RNA ligase family protein n=1 Tax=Glycomyces salinus TaxID=980294 RepID=UPI0018EE037B|nr:2'-5' RNA ligase family protein [Glycomyces salinus]
MTEYEVGLTALLATIEEAEPLVGRWRERFDPSAASGVPAHVTVLAPFLNAELLDTEVVEELRALFGGFGAFTVRFERCAYFPDLLYLEPTPDEPFRALTESVVERWPEAPPYAGKHPDLVPHLTVANGEEHPVLRGVESAVGPGLPVAAEVSSIGLFVYDGERWARRAEFPLHG